MKAPIRVTATLGLHNNIPGVLPFVLRVARVPEAPLERLSRGVEDKGSNKRAHQNEARAHNSELLTGGYLVLMKMKTKNEDKRKLKVHCIHTRQ